MKKISVFLLTLVPVLLPAQNLTIAYVDIPTAEKQVAGLESEIGQLETSTKTLASTNLELQNTINLTRSRVVEIAPVLNQVKEKNAEIYTFQSQITDRALREQTADALKRNKDLQMRLEARLEELEREALGHEKTLIRNQSQIAVNLARVQRLRDQIVIINAAIAKTRFQQNHLTESLQNVSSVQSEAEAFLQK